MDAEGVAYFAVAAPLPGSSHNGSAPRPDVAPLRLLLAGGGGGRRRRGCARWGSLLGDRDAGLLVYAVALEAWHSTHEFCPRCGSRTEVRSGGHVRVCPKDGSQHFPRVDPAVIMLIHDDQDRCLLARGPQWPEGRLSVLAGFVEPGESLEHAVAREVAEEVGVTHRRTALPGQPALAVPAQPDAGILRAGHSTEYVLDPEEIAEARWFSRAELLAAMESGEVRLPSEVSIARRLIETWYGEPLIGDW